MTTAIVLTALGSVCSIVSIAFAPRAWIRNIGVFGLCLNVAVWLRIAGVSQWLT